MSGEMHESATLDFGALLRRHRISSGLSQETLAERAGMSVNGISALERGIRHTPQRETLLLLLDALLLRGAERDDFERAATSRKSRHTGSNRLSGLLETSNSQALDGLPATLTSFVGRTKEIGLIVEAIRAHRLVTIAGPGGIGKTRTSLEIGNALREETTHGVYFVEFAPISDGSQIGSTIARALAVQQSTNRTALEQVAAFAKQRSVLLIFDNCEHLIDDVARAASTLLRDCPLLKILATSREALRVAGERTFRIRGLEAPLSSAPSIAADDAMRYGAIALFSERAVAIDHTFHLTDENAAVVAAICRALDGLPLAIELATAHLNKMQLPVLLENIERRFSMLASGERTASSRQQTLYAAIDWSYKLLTAPEQRAFERLSVFPDSCTLAAAVAMCSDDPSAAHAEDEILDMLSSLADKSLLDVLLDREEPRYRMLESTRAFASDRLADRAETGAISRKLLFFCVKIALQIGRLQETGTDAQWRELLHAEDTNISAALRWALIQKNDVATAQRLISLLYYAWMVFPRDGRSWTSIARRHVDEHTPKDIRAGLALLEAVIAWQYVETTTSFECAQEAAALFREINHESGRIWSVAVASLAQTSLGHLPSSAEVTQYVDDARALGRSRLLSFVLRTATVTCGALGEFERARAYNVEARVALASHEATLHMLMIAGHDRSRVEALDEKYELAIGIVRDSQRELGEGQAALSTWLLMDEPLWLASVGRFDEAKTALNTILSFAIDAGNDVLIARCLYNFALIASVRGESSSADFVRVAPLIGFAKRVCNEAGALPFAWRYAIIDVFEDCAFAASVAGDGHEDLARGACMTQAQAIAHYQQLSAVSSG